MNIVDDVILTDDTSEDNTSEISRSLGLHTIRHDSNRGYGGNQNTCYTAARARGADMGIMLHPEYQYTPKLVTAMASMIAYDQFDYVLASRILGKGALAAICPAISTSRIGLSRLPRTSCLAKRSPNNTGCRAWSRQVLERLPLMACSDDFVFDIQMIAQATYFGFCVG